MQPTSPAPDANGEQSPITQAVIRLAMAHRRLAGDLLGNCGMHPGQERLLFALRSGPRPLVALAADMGVNAPTVTKMVSRMPDLVMTAPSPDDRRVRLATLTPEGGRAASAAVEVWQRLEEVTVATLDPVERPQLHDLLTRCAEGLETALDGSEDPGACG